jgi:uncharacterized repeat protein (TIGR01451 family)
LAAFNGYLANGVWKLYVRDDLNQDFGVMTGGWSLAISSTDVVVPVVDLFESAIASAASVSVGQNLTYTANITNLGPATATNIFITGNFSSDVVLVSASGNVSTNQIDSQNIKCTLSSPLTNGARATISFTVRPAVEGNLTGTLTAQSAATEANAANNVVILTTTVSQAPPQLLAVRNSTSVTLTWPTTAANFVLETSTNFVDWVPVSGAPGTVGNNYSYTIPFTAGENGFYRLKSQ